MKTIKIIAVLTGLTGGKRYTTMRESTKALKNEMKKDIWKIALVNNSKLNKRTPEQKEQSRNDKVKFYKEKWEHKFRHAETNAQKECCLNVLKRIQNIR